MPHQSPPSTLDVLTISQLCARFECDRKTVLRWRGDGLPYSRVGRRVFFRAAAVDQWLADRERVDQPAAAPPAVRRKARSHQ